MCSCSDFLNFIFGGKISPNLAKYICELLALEQHNEIEK